MIECSALINYKLINACYLGSTVHIEFSTKTCILQICNNFHNRCNETMMLVYTLHWCSHIIHFTGFMQFTKRTPLHYAANSGSTGIVTLLVDHGANVNVKDLVSYIVIYSR